MVSFHLGGILPQEVFSMNSESIPLLAWVIVGFTAFWLSTGLISSCVYFGTTAMHPKAYLEKKRVLLGAARRICWGGPIGAVIIMMLARRAKMPLGFAMPTERNYLAYFPWGVDEKEYKPDPEVVAMNRRHSRSKPKPLPRFMKTRRV